MKVVSESPVSNMETSFTSTSEAPSLDCPPITHMNFPILVAVCPHLATFKLKNHHMDICVRCCVLLCRVVLCVVCGYFMPNRAPTTIGTVQVWVTENKSQHPTTQNVSCTTHTQIKHMHILVVLDILAT